MTPWKQFIDAMPCIGQHCVVMTESEEAFYGVFTHTNGSHAYFEDRWGNSRVTRVSLSNREAAWIDPFIWDEDKSND